MHCGEEITFGSKRGFGICPNNCSYFKTGVFELFSDLVFTILHSKVTDSLRSGSEECMNCLAEFRDNLQAAASTFGLLNSLTGLHLDLLYESPSIKIYLIYQ